MTHVPVSAPMAAVRAVRAAAWGATPLAHLHHIRAQLIDPIDSWVTAWHTFCVAFDAYTANPSSEGWDELCGALAGFDTAAAAFFGPSGWEQPRRPVRDRPEAMHGQ